MTTENTQVAVATQKPAGVARFTPAQVQAASLESGTAIPALAEAKVIPLPIGTEYWSPEAEGETKRCYVAGIEEAEIVDPNTGEVRRMPAVMLLEVIEDEKGRRAAKWMNAGKVLVGNIQSAIDRGQIVPGTALTPVQITYLGQKRNRSNSKLSNRWEILPLIVASAEAA